jgi:hypothetical protein
MDDVNVLAKTRWHLSKALRIVNEHFNQLKVAQVPEKTITNAVNKMLWLYEQKQADNVAVKYADTFLLSLCVPLKCSVPVER